MVNELILTYREDKAFEGPYRFHVDKIINGQTLRFEIEVDEGLSLYSCYHEAKNTISKMIKEVRGEG